MIIIIYLRVSCYFIDID